MRKSVLTFIVFILLSVIAFVQFSREPQTFIPNEDQGYFIISMQLMDGASYFQTAKAVEKASKILDELDGVETYITINGFSIMDNAESSNAASIFVMLKNWDERKNKSLSVGSIVNRFNEMAYLQIKEAEAYASFSSTHSRIGRE